MSSDSFRLLTSLGLRESDLVLDIGCGALELGSLLIPYLLPRHYFGVEPQQSLIEDGVRFTLGHDLFDRKQPQFITSVDFAFHKFAVKFDYMMAHALFPHIGASLIQACLRGAAAGLQPDGLLLASWMPGPRDYEGAGWNPHVEAEYTTATLQSMAQEAGLAFKVLDYSHPAGQCWAAFVLPGCRNVPDDIPFPIRQLPQVTEGHPGYVEQARDIGGHLLIEGWAIDPETRTPAERVLIADREGAIRATIPVHLPRPDAAALLGQGALMCGFRAVIRSEGVGDPAGLTYYATVTDNKTYSITYR
jgi:SAM-dependent methyltransferase